MTTQEIVSKLWNLCNVLRDDGITYHQYVTELTYILFLKMAKETGTEEQIPEKYRWDELKAKSGVELKKFYKELLSELGDNGTGRIREIYQGAATNIDEPKNLEKIIATIDSLDWYSAREEGLGNLYEGLLEKNANEKKSGAGQYFTPRVLIDVMTKLMKPQVGERCNDPACGTFGFMIAAHQYVAELIRRPELSYEAIDPIDEGRTKLPDDVIEQINITIKYQGYIDRQNQQVNQFKKLEKKKLPADIDYNDISNLRIEARQKLSLIRPENIGQASRISGVSPADISVLLVYLKMKGRD